MSYHFQGRRLYEDRLGERAVGRLRDKDSLSGQGLDDPPVVEVVEVGVLVEVGQGHAVQLSVGQRMHNVRLEVISILWGKRQE